MITQSNSPNLDDYEELAEAMFEQACDRSTAEDTPVGVVLAAVIYHLAIQAQLAALPEELLFSVISQAGATFRTFDCNIDEAEARS